MINNFTYNGHSTAEYGLLVTGMRIFSAPARKVEKYSVPGRNGDVIIELGGYDNITIQYELGVIKNFAVNANAIKNWLLTSNGYMKLEDTYDTDHYRLASLYSNIDYMTTALNREGKATIEFDCKPQRFLNSGETVKTITASSTTYNNPTSHHARPLIEVNGSSGYFEINGERVTINAYTGNSKRYVDCESQQVYYDTLNLNNYTTLEEFPTLKPGSNTITKSGLTNIKITPRWWEL